MKNRPRKILLPGVLVLLSLCALVTLRADSGGGTFTVAEGASPWYDRVGQWSLTNVPASLRGTGPLPQGSCGSRSLEVPGHPAAILLGVQVNDAARFTEKFPAAQDTGDQIAVRDAAGNTLPYTVFKLANPPATIDGAGVYGAGLLLLKVEGGK